MRMLTGSPVAWITLRWVAVSATWTEGASTLVMTIVVRNRVSAL